MTRVIKIKQLGWNYLIKEYCSASFYVYSWTKKRLLPSELQSNFR